MFFKYESFIYIIYKNDIYFEKSDNILNHYLLNCENYYKIQK